MDTRNQFLIKFDALQRLLMTNTVSGILPLYIVSEYPKSGGTWISQMIAEYLDIPFPRNRHPGFRSCVMHGHMLYSPLMRNVTVVFRDGRDAMASLYFHMLFENDKNSPTLVAKMRRRLGFRDYEDVRANMRSFIEYVTASEERSFSPYHFTWAKFVRSWFDRDVVFTKYESMVASSVSELERIVLAHTGEPVDIGRVSNIAEKYSFHNQAKRAPGVENRKSFLRKGKPSDWKDKFDRAAACLFDEIAGQELRRLGYVGGAGWVDECG